MSRDHAPGQCLRRAALENAIERICEGVRDQLIEWPVGLRFDGQASGALLETARTAKSALRTSPTRLSNASRASGSPFSSTADCVSGRDESQCHKFIWH